MSDATADGAAPAAAVIHQAAAAAAGYVAALRHHAGSGAPAPLDPHRLQDLQTALGGPLPEGGMPAAQVITDLVNHAPRVWCRPAARVGSAT